jgi:hypothetical protein
MSESMRQYHLDRQEILAVDYEVSYLLALECVNPASLLASEIIHLL